MQPPTTNLAFPNGTPASKLTLSVSFIKATKSLHLVLTYETVALGVSLPLVESLSETSSILKRNIEALTRRQLPEICIVNLSGLLCQLQRCNNFVTDSHMTLNSEHFSQGLRGLTPRPLTSSE